MTFAERIRKTVKKDLVVKSGLGEEVRMTISLGVTTMRDGDVSVDSIAKRAGEALSQAKASGKNRAELA